MHAHHLNLQEKGQDAKVPRAPGVCRPSLFHGREDELRDLVGALLQPSSGPTPVVGPVGVGRATLMLAALHDPRVAALHGPRRFFVRCDGARSRDALLIEIGRALGLEPWDLEERLFEELERGPAVLALTDLDVPWKADSDAVEALLSRLAGIPGLALVATLQGEPPPSGPAWRSAIRVDPLGLSAARETFLAIAGERFQDDPFLYGLLEAVDLLPLAVVLLAHAARLAEEEEPDLAPLWERWQAWRERRSGRLRWKGSQEWELHVEVPLEVALASPRVTPEARRLLSLLADLPDGVRPDDLGLLLPGDGDEAAAALKAAGLAFEERGRVRVLAPVREAVRREHPPQEEDLDRAVDLYLERGVAAEWIEEPGNIHSMLLLGLDGPDPEPAIRSALGLGDLVRSLGWGVSGLSELERARDVAREAGRDDLAALCAGMLGELAKTRSDLEGALRGYAEALHHYRRAEDIHGEALCLQSLGDLALEVSDTGTAWSRFEEALPLFRLAQDARGEAHCLRRMGDAEVERNDLDSATRHYEEALSVYRSLRDAVGEANCLRGLGEIALERSDFEAAGARYGEATFLYQKAGSLQGEAHCLRGRGDVALFQADTQTALGCYREALSLYGRIRDLLGQGNVLQRMGDVANALADPGAARFRYQEALNLYKKVGDRYSIGLVHVRLALLEPEGSDERRAHVETAREAWGRIGRTDLLATLEEV
ncbi:MAG TPA: tetratricopeptide repeat protein [Thermoanaerobaculia bacterium]|nr:tetratricopeptide repeat protein [Thermoanaerobaculia bacterium]